MLGLQGGKHAVEARAAAVEALPRCDVVAHRADAAARVAHDGDGAAVGAQLLPEGGGRASAVGVRLLPEAGGRRKSLKVITPTIIVSLV